ncbi:hypothetical protein F0562_007223 [Nyssa sinensis]|uniref:Uncharacterized protein n=1 Tax=Nyssa sinensis TaxID=561372 RepID=A0A5J5A4Q4_9ASTE|nr:hypothetical protein F0562_007223 [Nyssa sinensis]
MMNSPVDIEDLTIKILNGLDADYKKLANAIQARETAISFKELHEKLLNREAHLAATKGNQLTLPVTANAAANDGVDSHGGLPGMVPSTVAEGASVPSYPLSVPLPPPLVDVTLPTSPHTPIYRDPSPSPLFLPQTTSHAISPVTSSSNEPQQPLSRSDSPALPFPTSLHPMVAYASLSRNIFWISLPSTTWKIPNPFRRC